MLSFSVVFSPLRWAQGTTVADGHLWAIHQTTPVEKVQLHKGVLSPVGPVTSGRCFGGRDRRLPPACDGRRSPLFCAEPGGGAALS